MILCICEKPSVGADIAKILGASVKRDGFFEGGGYCVTWTFGHLCELKAPEDYTSDWKKWSLSTLPMIPERFGVKVKDDKGIKHQMKVIKTLVKKCDRVINCGDAGQEGELIQRWVMQEAGCDKPVQRLWISSLTDESIREGFCNLRPQKDFDNLYKAGMCRAIGDWILGMNATRLYTLKFSQRSVDGRNTILSIGRVQTPTLSLVVNRQREIEKFVPTTTYELRTNYREIVFTSDKIYATEAEGQAELKEIAAGMFEVISVVNKKTTEAAPKLFDLTSLQIEANKKYGMSADDTLKTIQSLYEKKLTTYPRVDTMYLTDDMYPKCMGILSSLSSYGVFIQPLMGSALKKSKRVFDNSKVTDHHAIIPTGKAVQSLTANEAQIYDMIAKRFISVFLPDCVYDQIQVSGKVGRIEFKANSKRIDKPGWRKLYEKEIATDNKADDGGKIENAVFPDFSVGEKGSHKPFIGKKTTTPPSFFTEGTLLKAMETAGASVDDETLREALKENGIGRPSTRAAIIETLYKRGYICKQGKSLRATEAGIKLIDLIKEDLLKSAKLTGIWENRLRAIERGEYGVVDFVNQLKAMIVQVTQSVMKEPSSVISIAANRNLAKKKTSYKKRK